MAEDCPTTPLDPVGSGCFVHCIDNFIAFSSCPGSTNSLKLESHHSIMYSEKKKSEILAHLRKEKQHLQPSTHNSIHGLLTADQMRKEVVRGRGGAENKRDAFPKGFQTKPPYPSPELSTQMAKVWSEIWLLRPKSCSPISIWGHDFPQKSDFQGRVVGRHSWRHMAPWR